MSLKIDRLQLEIVINNDQARKSLRALEDESRQLTAEMKKLDKTTEEYAQKDTRLKGIKLQMDKIYESIGLAGLTMKELTNRQKELNSMMRNMDPRLPQYQQLQGQLKAVNGRMGELRDQAKDTGFSMSKLGDQFNRYQMLAVTVLAVFVGLVTGLRKVVGAFNEFEKAVDFLSALTGLVGKNLKWLSEEAKKMSTAVIEGNIRITASATEIVNAYEKVGSKRPELLKVKEDLASVTQEAMILAAAANGELQPAVDGLTMVMNQFNTPASDARKIINIMAAGAKEGAGEIDYLTSGFEKSGSVAHNLNIEIEDLAGVLETLAPRISAPEMAGRSLRNIMLILEEQTDKKLRPSMVGLGKAFENLRDKQYDTVKMGEIFGRENINAATILVRNVSETNKYTAAITGTNVALEQAATNTDNNASKLLQAQNRVQLLAITFGEKLAPAMTFSTNSFSYFMKAMLALPKVAKDNQILLITLGGAILAYNAILIKNTAISLINHLILKEGIGLKIKEAIVMKTLIIAEELATIWKAKGTVASKLAATAQWAWNAAISANPIGAIIIAITALVVAMKLYGKYSEDAILLESRKATALKMSADANDLLAKSYENTSIVIDKLNLLSAEQKTALLKNIETTLSAAEANLLLLDSNRKLIEQNSKPTVGQTVWNRLKNAAKPNYGGSAENLASLQEQSRKENAAENTEEINKGIEALQSKIQQFKKAKEDLWEVVKAESIADGITGKSITQLEEKQRYLTTALKNYEKGTADYIRIAEKLQKVNKLLEADDTAATEEMKKAKTAMDLLNESIAKKTLLLENQILKGNPAAKETAQELAKLIAEKGQIESVIEAYKKLYLTRTGGTPMKKLASIGITSIGTPEKAGNLPDTNAQTSEAKRLASDQWYAEESYKIYEDLEQRKADLQAAAIQTSTQLLTMAADYQYEHEMNLLDKKYSKEEKKLKKMLDNKEISQEDYDKKVEKLNLAKHKKEVDLARKHARQEQEIATLAIGVNLAKTIFSITAKAAEFAAGVVTAPLAAVALAQIPWVIGAAALETGLVWAKPLPEYSQGGGTGDGFGLPDHTGQRPAGYVHADEYVIPAWERKLPQVMQMEGIIEAIRLRGFASGGSVQNHSATNNTGFQYMDPQMIISMNRFSDTIEKLQADGFETFLNYQHLQKFTDKVLETENRTSL